MQVIVNDFIKLELNGINIASQLYVDY